MNKCFVDISKKIGIALATRFVSDDENINVKYMVVHAKIIGVCRRCHILCNIERNGGDWTIRRHNEWDEQISMMTKQGLAMIVPC